MTLSPIDLSSSRVEWIKGLTRLRWLTALHERHGRQERQERHDCEGARAHRQAGGWQADTQQRTARGVQGGTATQAGDERAGRRSLYLPLATGAKSEPAALTHLHPNRPIAHCTVHPHTLTHNTHSTSGCLPSLPSLSSSPFPLTLKIIHSFQPTILPRAQSYIPLSTLPPPYPSTANFTSTLQPRLIFLTLDNGHSDHTAGAVAPVTPPS